MIPGSGLTGGVYLLTSALSFTPLETTTVTVGVSFTFVEGKS